MEAPKPYKMAPTEKTLAMKLAFFKAEMHALIRELENDLPGLRAHSLKYHRFFLETLRRRVEKAEKALEGVRYIEVND